MTSAAQPARRPRLALLVDAENVPPAFAEALVDDATGHGQVAIRRAYGDFSGERLRGWAEACPQLAIRAHQVFPGAWGKNAADLALAIDAIDLFHTGGIEGFCLVSSDSDFSHLALRLREHGVMVIGYGERKAPASFRRACDRFIELVPPPPVLVADVPIVAKPIVVKPPAAKPIAPVPVVSRPIPSKPCVKAARKLLEEAYGHCTKTADGWINAGPLGSELAKMSKPSKSPSHGYGGLQKFIAWAGGFEMKNVNKVMFVKRRT